MAFLLINKNNNEVKEFSDNDFPIHYYNNELFPNWEIVKIENKTVNDLISENPLFKIIPKNGNINNPVWTNTETGIEYLAKKIPQNRYKYIDGSLVDNLTMFDENFETQSE